jgi:hypothetical protein
LALLQRQARIASQGEDALGNQMFRGETVKASQSGEASSRRAARFTSPRKNGAREKNDRRLG